MMDEFGIETSFSKFYSSSVQFFDVRFSFYVSKISSLLNTIQHQLSECSSFEIIDDDVIVRERRMSTEFERRFARINLYSIFLKLKKLEKEIVVFKLRFTCKITQAFVLRRLVLSIFNYLVISLQTYSQFMQKLRVRICTKLEDLLNYISLAYSITTSIVNHRVLEMHNLTLWCYVIVRIIHKRNMTLPSSKTRKTRENIKRPKRKIHHKKYRSNLKEKILTARSNFITNPVIKRVPALPDTKNKSVRFEIYQTETDIKTVTSNVRHDQLIPKLRGSLTTRLCMTTLRLCDVVLEDLLQELIRDILDCIQCITIDTFDREFIQSNR